MFGRKELPPPSQHQQTVVNAERVLATEQDALDAKQGVINECEAELLLIGQRHEERQQRRNAAYVEHEGAQAAHGHAATYHSVAQHEASAGELNEAESALNESAAKLKKTLAQVDLEEEKDNDRASALMKSKVSAEVAGAQHRLRVQALTKSRDKAFAAHGAAERKELTLKFKQIEDQENAARQALKDLSKQKKALETEARARLRDYPDVLRDVLHAHIPYEDDVTRLLRSNIEYRKQVLVIGPVQLYAVVDRAHFPDTWLDLGVWSMRSDWFEQTTQDIEKWISKYIDEERSKPRYAP